MNPVQRRCQDLWLLDQKRLLHLCLRKDPDGRGCGEDSSGDSETHREPGHRDRPGEVREHEEKPQISRGYLWISIVYNPMLYLSIFTTKHTLPSIYINLYLNHNIWPGTATNNKIKLIFHHNAGNWFQWTFSGWVWNLSVILAGAGSVCGIIRYLPITIVIVTVTTLTRQLQSFIGAGAGILCTTASDQKKQHDCDCVSVYCVELNHNHDPELYTITNFFIVL